jgi:cobalt/nickel transport system permease protein
MIDRYQSAESLIHHLDPRVKVMVALGLIIGIVSTPDRAFPAYPLLWSLIASLILIAHLSVWRVGRMATLALPFSLAAATLMFTMPGDTLVAWGGLTISDAGVIRFVAILLKSWLAVQAALLLAMTTPFPDLLWALQSLKIPGILVTIISFMYRYLVTLRDEAERLLRARAARSGRLPGYPAGGSLWWRARVAGSLIGNLFLRSYERSERVYAAMLARGYDGHMQITSPPQLTRQAVLQGGLPLIILIGIRILAGVWLT